MLRGLGRETRGELRRATAVAMFRGYVVCENDMGVSSNDATVGNWVFSGKVRCWKLFPYLRLCLE